MKRFALLLTVLLFSGTFQPAAAIPSPFAEAADAVTRLGSTSMTVLMKRPLPLAQHLSFEKYLLDIDRHPGGTDFRLQGVEGNNRGRVFTCKTPCTQASVSWPGRPPIIIPQGDPRLFLVQNLDPADELRLVGQLVEDTPSSVTPLIKYGRTRYAYPIKHAKDVKLFAGQLWQLKYGKNQYVEIQLTLDNETRLPTHLRVTQRAKKDVDKLPLLKFDKWWKFQR